MNADERMQRAFDALKDCVKAGLQARMTSAWMTGCDWRDGEYDIVFEPRTIGGLLHEDIKAAVEIAERHGGHLWLGKPDHELAILWPTKATAAGPDDPSPGERERIEARGGTVEKPKRKRS